MFLIEGAVGRMVLIYLDLSGLPVSGTRENSQGIRKNALGVLKEGCQKIWKKSNRILARIHNQDPMKLNAPARSPLGWVLADQPKPLLSVGNLTDADFSLLKCRLESWENPEKTGESIRGPVSLDDPPGKAPIPSRFSPFKKVVFPLFLVFFFLLVGKISVANSTQIPIENALQQIAPKSKEISVDEAVRIALSQNTSILSLRSTWKAKTFLEETAIAPSDPIIEFLYGEGNQGVNTPYGSGTGWSIFQNMLFPGKSWIDKSISESQASILHEDYIEKRRILINQTEKACYTLLLDEESLRENRRLINWLKRVQEITRIRVAANKAPLLDYLSAKNAVKQAILRRIAYNLQLLSAKRQLNTLLNIPLKTVIQISSLELPQKPPVHFLPLKDLDLSLDKKRPDVKKLQGSLELGIQQLSRAEMDYLPDFQLQGAEGDIGCYGFSNTNCYSLGVAFNFPIFFSIKQQRKIESLKQTISAKKWLLRWQKSLAVIESLDSQTRAIVAFKTFEINDQEILPDSELAFTLALGAYETQKISFLYLITALNNFHQSRYNRFKSLINYYNALSDLEAVTASSRFLED
jgi:outer membrane protein TolC